LFLFTSRKLVFYLDFGLVRLTFLFDQGLLVLSGLVSQLSDAVSSSVFFFGNFLLRQRRHRRAVRRRRRWGWRRFRRRNSVATVVLLLAGNCRQKWLVVWREVAKFRSVLSWQARQEGVERSCGRWRMVGWSQARKIREKWMSVRLWHVRSGLHQAGRWSEVGGKAGGGRSQACGHGAGHDGAARAVEMFPVGGGGSGGHVVGKGSSEGLRHGAGPWHAH